MEENLRGADSSPALIGFRLCTILQNERMRRCGVPPSIIFERLKLPQQIMYPRKGNLSENLNNFKYRKNILISRFQIYNLFREKFKFRGFTKAFKNFAKYVIAFIFAKFKYFAKQIIYLESPGHQLQNDI